MPDTRSIPFSLRRRFIALPEDAADAMYHRAFGRAILALKIGAGVLGAIFFALYLYIATPDMAAIELRDLPERLMVATMIALTGYGVTLLALSRCVLRLACGAVLRSFAASQGSHHAVRE